MAALDLSDYADFVLTKAIKTARQQNAKLDIVVVAEHKNNVNGMDELIKDATRAAHTYRQKSISQGMKAKIRVLSGTSAADEIIKYQQSENLDLIVLGRRSHAHQGTFPMGAVAQRVAAYATCTVMIVRCMEKQ